MFDALLTRWKDKLLRIFDIRTGEFKRVWLMLLNVFLLIQCLWIIKPVVNAQFISRVGIDQLPLVFLLVAITALIFFKPYSKILNQLSLGKLMLRTYVVSILSVLGFAILMQLHLFADWMSFVFYIGVALFGLITTSQFWLLGNFLFNSLEAKRLFGFIGAGAIAGGISGGYLTSLMTGFMDSQAILFVAAGMLTINLVLNQRIWDTLVPTVSTGKINRAMKTLEEYPMRNIRRSKQLSYLAIIVGIGVLVSKLVEFQFSAIASHNISDPDELTAYFGFWFSTSNAVAFVIQLIVTQRLVGFLGVGRSLFVLPGALFVSSLALLKYPFLWAGTTIKVVDIALKQSVNKAATELLIMPVPMNIKSQAKTYIDVFVDTTATGVGGILLILVINGLQLSVGAVSILILVLIVAWIYYSIKARKEYVRAFHLKLGITAPPQSKKDLQMSETSVVQEIRNTLQSGTVEQIIFLLENIEEGKDPVLMKYVIPLLNHVSAQVRVAALSCLYYHTDHSITKDIAPLLKDPNEDVRSRAFSCLLAHTRNDRVNFINQYLEDPDPAINGAALIGLATETRDNPKMQQQFNLEMRLLDKMLQTSNFTNPEDLEDTKIMVAKATGYGNIKSFYPLIKEMMQDKNPAVVKQAILAAGNTQDLGFVYVLVAFLPDILTRYPAQKALAKYKSSEILPLLVDLSAEPGIPLDLLIQLPSLAQRMETEQAIDFLFGLLVRHQHSALKLEALEVLHKLKAKFPRLTITAKRIMPILIEEADLYKDTLALSYVARQSKPDDHANPYVHTTREALIQMLERKLDNNLKRIFWILGLSYPPGTMVPLFRNLRNQDHNIRISAVELLDNLLDPTMKKVVLSIVETAMLSELTFEDLHRLELKVPTETSCYELLLNGKDDQVKIAVLDLLEALQDPKYEYLIEMAMKDEHVRVKGRAEEIGQSLAQKEAPNP